MDILSLIKQHDLGNTVTRSEGKPVQQVAVLFMGGCNIVLIQ